MGDEVHTSCLPEPMEGRNPYEYLPEYRLLPSRQRRYLQNRLSPDSADQTTHPFLRHCRRWSMHPSVAPQHILRIMME